MENDILDIISEYNPYNNPYTKSLLENGISGLVREAENNSISINVSEYYSPCKVCRAIVDAVRKN